MSVNNKIAQHLCNTCQNQYAHKCNKVRLGTPELFDGIEYIRSDYPACRHTKRRDMTYTVIGCERYERQKKKSADFPEKPCLTK
jgi:hypothetical protein